VNSEKDCHNLLNKKLLKTERNRKQIGNFSIFYETKTLNISTYSIANALAVVVDLLVQEFKQSWRVKLKVLHTRLFGWPWCLNKYKHIHYINILTTK